MCERACLCARITLIHLGVNTISVLYTPMFGRVFLYISRSEMIKQCLAESGRQRVSFLPFQNK